MITKQRAFKTLLMAITFGALAATTVGCGENTPGKTKEEEEDKEEEEGSGGIVGGGKAGGEGGGGSVYGTWVRERCQPRPQGDGGDQALHLQDDGSGDDSGGDSSGNGEGNGEGEGDGEGNGDGEGGGGPNFQREELTLNEDESFNLTMNMYAEEGCQGDSMLTMAVTGTYALGEDSTVAVGATDIDISIGAGSVTLLHQAAVDGMNSGAFCGKSDWELNVQVDIATLTCEAGKGPPMPGTVQYDIVAIASDIMMFGKPYDPETKESIDITQPGNRPTVLEDHPEEHYHRKAQ